MSVQQAEPISVSKNVEIMSINGDQPPSEFIVKEFQFGSIDTSPPLGPFPVIDISHFSNSSSPEAQLQLENLRSSLSSSGCFQAIGHGISESFLDKVREVATQFFAFPEEEKLFYGRAVNESEGYGSDRVVSQKQVLDWSQRLSLTVFPEDKRRLNLWPQNPSQFSEILDEYAMKIKTVTEVLFKAIAKSLNVDEESFSNQFGARAQTKARFNFYPPCSRPDLVLGVKPHTDRSGITILLQDKDVEGLQVCINGKWYRVPVISNALLVNLGDQMQIMTNGIYKSPMHRVVTNTERLRMSLALFIEPEPEREIGPVEDLIDEQRPRIYRNVKDYGAINYECYQKGLVALETVKV
ncbi:probable 2-oxoglutarate/Fe(II)-dependent dioxygenase [Mangifera indica]|uniref:probable 2-oxoglutarate/Fe(II)-dependent dioxygenase n=1 Tax=Mangifera indica TaxID=29780 RepID=UPI001CFC0B04|nr:probable 2-oxoglutarate/Fe(II)-dependent dioxygenase [Mangifera indica]